MEIFFAPEYLEKIFAERISKSNFRGVDGINARAFTRIAEQEISFIAHKVAAEQYEFSRYKEKLILKGSASLPRQISIPTIRDALALRALCDLLASAFSESIPKPPHDYIKRIVAIAAKSEPETSLVRLDIRNFYPSINHETLLAKLAESGLEQFAVTLVKRAIETPTGVDRKVPKNPMGVPQGLSISNILAAFYFRDFDMRWSKKVNYFRYVDDILIICPTSIAKDTLNAVVKDLSDSLSLSAHELSQGGSGKTSLTDLASGTDYLGFTISDKTLRVREKSYRKIFDAIAKIFTRHKYDKSDERFLWKLNLRITGCKFEERSVGWVFYFRQMTDMSQLHRLDVFVQQMLAKFGRSDLADRVLKFVKAYREIRFNREGTIYVPDFDNYTLANMIRTIALLTKESEAALAEDTRANIQKKFFALIKKQTVQLERESVDFSVS
jgi:RNA-directed DNA polymerase